MILSPLIPRQPAPMKPHVYRLYKFRAGSRPQWHMAHSWNGFIDRVL